MTNHVIKPEEKRLGRIHVPDSRDKQYSISPILQAAPKKASHYQYWWTYGWYGDQGLTSQCVSYAWLHWVEDGPITHHADRVPILDTTWLYNECQKVDQWPGEDYDGTSVRAGAKILQKQGLVKEYRWAFTIQDVIDTLLNLGPMVVGTYWYYDMFFPDKKGWITATGQPMGGHAYVLNGVNVKDKKLRIKNSWGQGWGINGRAWISFDDFEKLLNQYGEACIAMEIPSH